MTELSRRICSPPAHWRVEAPIRLCSDDGQFGSKTNEGGTAETLEATSEAEAMAERSEGRWWSAELHRLRGVFLAAMGAEETQIEASFCAAIRIAKEQKSVSLEKRAEGTYAEYRRQKASALGGRGFRLPLR